MEPCVKVPEQLGRCAHGRGDGWLTCLRLQATKGVAPTGVGTVGPCTLPFGNVVNNTNAALTGAGMIGEATTMQRVIDEMHRTAENHRPLTEPVPIPLLTLERWIEQLETAAGIAADIKYVRENLGELERAVLGIGNQAQDVEDTIDKLAGLLGDEPVTAVQTTMEVG